MKHQHLVIVLSLLLLASTAAAQPVPGDVGVFFDAAGTTVSGAVTAFVPFQFYVLGFDLSGDVKGFEVFVQVPSEVVVLARNLPPGWLNVGGQDNFIVGTAGCLDGSGAFQLVQYECLVLVSPAPVDLLVCLAPSVPTSFSPPTPGYLECDNTLTPFTLVDTGSSFYPDGCGIINPTAPQEFRVEAEILAGIETAFPGEAVEVPISLAPRLFNLKTIPIPPTVLDVSCTISWDETVASYENVRLDTFLTDRGWSMTAMPQAGSVAISASGPSFDTTFDLSYMLFQVELRLSLDGGATVLTVDPTEVNGGNTPSFGTPGALSEDVVPTRQESFGAVKSRFGG